MRFYHIALFLFIFNLIAAYFAGFAVDLGYSESIKLGEPAESQLQDVEQSISQQIGTTEVTNENIVSSILNTLSGMLKSVTDTILYPLRKMVNWLPVTLQQLGVPHNFAMVVTAIFYLVQIIGFGQYVIGRGFGEVE